VTLLIADTELREVHPNSLSVQATPKAFKSWVSNRYDLAAPHRASLAVARRQVCLDDGLEVVAPRRRPEILRQDGPPPVAQEVAGLNGGNSSR
jgi:hypothetical protein